MILQSLGLRRDHGYHPSAAYLGDHSEYTPAAEAEGVYQK